ncbi:hypothetical protein NQ036_13040 [Brevibacterium sp. 91QC2O2]|uniref:hypothetical protein n=1 Tax=Brevibacterium sp. 91QC2O2 TaxID=2968458 RepID=UPI00211B81D6|nr:hypothetical protein [Brevibacterium sp. 91QC2O2]MCQ9369165.1 hypothetical protein [Brevibacterium sp. 91QC2O2]
MSTNQNENPQDQYAARPGVGEPKRTIGLTPAIAAGVGLLLVGGVAGGAVGAVAAGSSSGGSSQMGGPGGQGGPGGRDGQGAQHHLNDHSNRVQNATVATVRKVGGNLADAASWAV